MSTPSSERGTSNSPPLYATELRWMFNDPTSVDQITDNVPDTTNREQNLAMSLTTLLKTDNYDNTLDHLNETFDDESEPLSPNNHLPIPQI